jgi:predicted NBD/HSP70 family sugar kinase
MSITRIIIATILSLIIFTIGIGIGIGIASTGKITIARWHHNVTGQTSTTESHGRTTRLGHHRDLKALATARHTVLTLDVRNVL